MTEVKSWPENVKRTRESQALQESRQRIKAREDAYHHLVASEQAAVPKDKPSIHAQVLTARQEFVTALQAEIPRVQSITGTPYRIVVCRTAIR